MSLHFAMTKLISLSRPTQWLGETLLFEIHFTVRDNIKTHKVMLVGIHLLINFHDCADLYVTGRDGLVGTPGKDGHPGALGAPGPPGVAGISGTTQLTESGERGERGAAGSKGEKGPRGEPGLPGDSGAVYTRWGRRDCTNSSTLIYEGKLML